MVREIREIGWQWDRDKDGVKQQLLSVQKELHEDLDLDLEVKKI